MKRCCRCGETKEVDGFSRNRANADGRQSWCKACFRLDHHERKDRDAILRQARQRRRLYGMAPEDFDRLVEVHDNRCAICAHVPTGAAWDRTLHVDHDHQTGEVRGLLCGNCNRGIGLLGDDPDVVFTAFTYLIGASSIPTKETTP